MTARWSRPYLLTGGRTGGRHPLYTHTLISAPHFDKAMTGAMKPEARALYEWAASGLHSIAELSAHADVPLGVTRVLLNDLIQAGHVVITPDTYSSPYDPALMERVLDGLRQLT
jgi:hypothetical protein